MQKNIPQSQAAAFDEHFLNIRLRDKKNVQFAK